MQGMFKKGQKPPKKKEKAVPHFEQYGVYWPEGTTQLEIEMQCVRQGGHWYGWQKQSCGLGLFEHFKRLKSLLWPQIVWHKWNEKELHCFLNYRIIGEMGPASSGKSHSAATNFLAEYWCYPDCTTVIVSSTTRESLEMRVWGEMKAYFRDARNRTPWLSGNLIEGRQRIVTDDRSESVEGRDFRNGIVGIACKKGQTFQGLGEYVGIKNKRVRLLADELQFMPKDFISAISNLNKNENFKCTGCGNPKDTLDALGTLCEPAAHLGGWDGGIDQQPGTKTWQIRFEDGVALQLPGSDSPNLDGKLGIPIITQKDIDKDIAFWGKDSIQYTMMNEGRMPRGQGSRRVLTRILCQKFRALEDVIWKDGNQVKIWALDAAYRGVGGDRCVFGELRYGLDVEDIWVLALVETVLVPITDDTKVDPEDQIAEFTKQQCIMRGIPPNQGGFDSTGRGTLMSAFARLWSSHVIPVEFGGGASDRVIQVDEKGNKVLAKDRYANRVTEFWFNIRLIVEAGQWRGLSEDAMQEGCAREWGFVGHNKIQVEPKDKMKLKTGRSPDLFDMLVVGGEVALRLGFPMADFSVEAKNPSNHSWQRKMREQQEKIWHAEALHY
jgi:hypothetical protein